MVRLSGVLSPEEDLSSTDGSSAHLDVGQLEPCGVDSADNYLSVSENQKGNIDPSTRVTPPTPAPRRSARVKSTAHLRPNYVYNFPQVSGDGETMGSAIPASDKINLLKGFLKLF